MIDATTANYPRQVSASGMAKAERTSISMAFLSYHTRVMMVMIAMMMIAIMVVIMIVVMMMIMMVMLLILLMTIMMDRL